MKILYRRCHFIGAMEAEDSSKYFIQMILEISEAVIHCKDAANLSSLYARRVKEKMLIK